MSLSANRGQPPGEAGQIGSEVTLAFEFSNGVADVVVGLRAGNWQLPYSIHPLTYTISARNATGAAAVCSLTVDVLVRVVGGAFASIVGGVKPALTSSAEAANVAATGWPDLLVGTFPLGHLDSLTLGPSPKKVTLSVNGLRI